MHNTIKAVGTYSTTPLMFDVVINRTLTLTIRHQAINNTYRGQIQALAAQWEAHKAQVTTKEERESVESARAKIDDTYKQIGEIMQAKGTYDIFQEFQKNCGEQTPKVYGRMENETLNLMFKAIGHEL